MNPKNFDIIFTLILTLLISIFVYTSNDKKLFAKEPVRVISKTENNPFSNLDIVARDVFVYDIRDNKVLFSRNPNEIVALASLAKLMAIISAKSAIATSSVIYVTPDAIGVEGDTGLFVNEAWKVNDLLALTIVSSSNDGARTLRDYIKNTYDENLVALMNKKAKELGLSTTYFINESGLDINKKISGAYGTAYDIAKILIYAYKNDIDLFRSTREKEITLSSINYGEHVFENTNIIVDTIPSLLISKTGFTDIAGGNLAIVFEKEPLHPIVVVVLGSTEDARFTDMSKLVWASIEK